MFTNTILLTITMIVAIFLAVDVIGQTASASQSDLNVQQGMAILETQDCGINKRENRFPFIGNGDDAVLADYPWMTLLKYDNGVTQNLGCGGSLISDQYVLTAAHCIRVRRMKLISVILGEHDLSKDIDCANIYGEDECSPSVQEISVEESIYHKDFSASKFSNDIGLIRLSRKVIFSDTIKPICLPITADVQRITLNGLTIAGWGQTEIGKRANILQTAYIPIQDNDYCQKINKLIRITEKHTCAGGKLNIDTCKGDSGGPLFATTFYRELRRQIQYGIVSAGSSQCGVEFPGIYTNVIAYISWIIGNIRP